jgi:hypothetical protein
VVALTYRATVDVPARFRKSKAVGAVFGLTCSKYQSGEIDRSGRISRCGDEMMRVMLYEAAQSMLRSKKWSWLKALQIARRRGMKKGDRRSGRVGWPLSSTASGLTAPSSDGPGKPQWQEAKRRLEWRPSDAPAWCSKCGLYAQRLFATSDRSAYCDVCYGARIAPQ